MRRRLLRSKVWPALYAIPVALGFLQLYRPEPALGRDSGSQPAFATAASHISLGRPSAGAFGRSGEIKLLFALPGTDVRFPLDFDGDTAGIEYEWTSVRGIEAGFDAQPIAGARLIAPATPGFYYLTLVRDGIREIVAEPAVAVMRPFEEKTGPSLNGYRIGTYAAERVRGRRSSKHPVGFLEVYPQHIDMPLSTHLRVRDFVTQDDQANVWPKYVALSPRLVEKLELVFAELEKRQSDTAGQDLRLGVHSGFRTPSHNRRVRHAAKDSRHQYGDAADLVVDANRDGRIDRSDWRQLAKAVETVEQKYPDLLGGLGIYNSRKYPAPYVHIDVRGKRTRWRG
jgi:hypothetical protein